MLLILFQLFAQFVFLTGGVLLAVFPTSVIGIFIGRIFVGHATGLTYLTMLANCGEIPTLWNRGTITSLIQLALSLGIFVFTICNTIVTSESNPHHLNRVIGCITVLIIVLTYVCHHFIGIESPVYLLATEKYSDASILMRDLRNENYESRETRYEYEQIRIMVIEDSLEMNSVFKTKSFYLMLFVKFLATFMFTQPLNYIKIALVSEYIELWSFQATLLMGVKVLVSLIPIFSIDGHGRRCHILWLSRFTAIVLVGLGIAVIFKTWVVTIIVFIVEIMTGMGLTMAVDTLCTEVFSTRKKGTGLSFLLSVENVVHIILIALTMTMELSKTFYYVTVFLSAILIWVLGIIEIPETRRLTLKEARKRFHGIDFSCKM